MSKSAVMRYLYSILYLVVGVLALADYQTYAALGDSYAAGDGAGSSKLLPDLCARFSGAYPVHVAKNDKLDFAGFRNLACGGATTTSVLKTQVYRIWDSDTITVQVGGNEVDFFVLLNECVYQWKPFSTCDAELSRARGLVESMQFINNFDNLVAATKKYIKPGARLLVLGYARFFNDQTDQCDHVSFSTHNPDNYLTKEMRIMFNNVVLLLNDVILGIAEAHGVTYIDMDKVFEGHRFCEEGVIEPAPDASWFFSDAGRATSKFAERHGAEIDQKVLHNPFKEFLNFTATFHPTEEGHIAIAQEIERVLLS